MAFEVRMFSSTRNFRSFYFIFVVQAFSVLLCNNPLVLSLPNATAFYQTSAEGGKVFCVLPAES